jgi:hypothetical protein
MNSEKRVLYHIYQDKVNGEKRNRANAPPAEREAYESFLKWTRTIAVFI